MKRGIALVAGLLLAGCGGGISIAPEDATADHNAAAPGNSVTLTASTNCPAFKPCAQEPSVAWTTSNAALGELDHCGPGGNSCTVVCRGAGTVTIIAASEGLETETTVTCR